MVKFAPTACVVFLLAGGIPGGGLAVAGPSDNEPAVKESGAAAEKSKRSSSSSGRIKKRPAKEKQSDAPQLLAGPTNEHPHRPLPLWWSDGEASQLWPEATAAYGRALKLIVALEKNKDSKKSKGQLAQFGQAHVALLQVERMCEQMALWSEPAAIELGFRREELHVRLQALYIALRTQYQDVIAANAPAFAARCKKQEKQLDKIRQMFEAGKLDEAQSLLVKIYDDLAVVGAWYGHNNPRRPMASFEELMAEIKGPLNTQRQKAAVEAIGERRKQVAPDFAALLADVKAASEAIGKQGQVEIARKKSNGPQALAAFLTRWQQTQAAAVQTQAIDWARFTGGGQAAIVKLKAQHAAFLRDIGPTLARLISADAGQIDDAQAEARYVEYLEVLAPTVSLAADDKLAAALEPALAEIAQKSPGLAARVGAYRAATSDALRWRHRLAAAEARHARGNRQPTSLPPDYEPLLQRTVAALLPEFSESLLKPGAWMNLVGSNERRVATGGYDMPRVYPTVELDAAALASASIALGKLLLVGEGLPPLTLEAAIALAQTERGDLIEVGGDVESFGVEAVIPLFAHWTTADWGPVMLDRLGGDIFGDSKQLVYPVFALRMRLFVRPQWVCQPYAFIRLREG